MGSEYLGTLIDEVNQTSDDITRKLHHPTEDEFLTSKNEMKNLEREVPKFKAQDKKTFLEFVHKPYTREMAAKCIQFVKDKAPDVMSELGLPW